MALTVFIDLRNNGKHDLYDEYTIFLRGNRMRKSTAIVFVMMVSVFSSSWAQQVFYVSPEGRNSGTGAVDKPFATLEKARETVKLSDAEGEKKVYLRGGTYYLSDTFVLTSEDSGTADHPVTYQAYPGEEVIISGGTKLQLKWRPYSGGIYQAQTPTQMTIDQLFVNGKRRHMARYPNYDENARPYNGAAADAFSPARAAKWGNPEGGISMRCTVPTGEDTIIELQEKTIKTK